MKPKKYKYNGAFLTLKELSDLSEISLGTIKSRLYDGWTVDDAIHAPLTNRGGANFKGAKNQYPTKRQIERELSANRKRAFTTFAQCAGRTNAK